jgi:hypothetical protein
VSPSLSLSELMARGWTQAMVENLLGAPDEFRDNGARYKTMMYRLDRVLAAEQTWEFSDARAMARVRAAKIRAGMRAS